MADIAADPVRSLRCALVTAWRLETPRARRRDPPGAHWGQSAPPRGRGGPAPPAPARPRGGDPLAGEPPRGWAPGGGRARRRSAPSAPGFGERCCRGAVTLGGWAPRPSREGGRGGPPSHLPRRPSQPSRSRSRRTAAVEMRPAAAGRRVESSGRTARTPPVYLLTVSRPLELSLQSSFQLSLTVLVDYRSRAGI